MIMFGMLGLESKMSLMFSCVDNLSPGSGTFPEGDRNRTIIQRKYFLSVVYIKYPTTRLQYSTLEHKLFHA